MATMRGFSKRMKVIAEGVPRNADQLVRTVVIAADTTVVLATPVDTGRARANWQAAIGAPAEGQVQGYPAGAGGSTGQQAGALAMAQAAGVAAQYKGGTGTAVHLTNNLPYIGRLNEGSSKQAPAQYVRKAIDAAVRAIGDARIIRR